MEIQQVLLMFQTLDKGISKKAVIEPINGKK